MARHPGQYVPPQPRPLYNPNDPTLLSTVMRKNLEQGAAAQRALQTTIKSLPRHSGVVSLQPEQVQTVRRQLPILTRRPIWLSVENARNLQTTLFAAWRVIHASDMHAPRTQQALASWHMYFKRALDDASGGGSR